MLNKTTIYKVYAARRKIPWINGELSIYPNYRINDSFFNFQELTNAGVYFDSYESGRIVIESDQYEYFKIERIKENGNIYKSYWYTDNINKVMDNEYELNVKLDYYMTHIKEIIKNMKTDNSCVPLIKRGTINKNLVLNENTKAMCLNILSKKDEYIDKIDKHFKGYEYLNLDNYPFPWNVTYILYKDPGVVGEYVYNTTIIKHKPNTDSSYKQYSLNSGYYVVMRHNNGHIDFFPIGDNTVGLIGYNTEDGPNSIKYDYPIGTDWMTTYTDLIGRKNYAIQTNYPQNAFLGIYSGPIPKNVTTLIYASKVTSDTAQLQFLCYRLDAFTGLKWDLNLDFNINDFLNEYIKLLQPVILNGATIIPAEYFSFYNFSNKLNIQLRYTYLDGFVAIPIFNDYVNDNVINFGSTLPSPDSTFIDKMRNINTNINTGIASGVGSVAWGLSKGNFLGTALKTVGNITNLALNYEQQRRNIQGGYITSTVDDFKRSTWYGTSIINSNLLNNAIQQNGRQQVGTRRLFTTQQKDQLKYILSNWGFAINMNVNFNEYLNNIQNENIYYFEIDDTWLQMNISKYLPSNLTISNKTMSNINEIFSNGIRIKGEWS